MLVSCGTPADTTANADNTNEPMVTDESAQTDEPATEDNDPGEPSVMNGVSPLGGKMYKLNFENGHSVEIDSTNAEKVFDEIKAKGYLGSLLGMLSSSAFEIEKAAGDIGAKAKGRAIKKILEDYERYFEIVRDEKVKKIDVQKTQHFYVNSDGKSYPEFGEHPLAYSQLFEVRAGDVFEILADGEPMRVYRIVAYRDGATDNNALGKETMSYKVTGDTTHIIASFVDTDKKLEAQITNEKNMAMPKLKKFVDADYVAYLGGLKEQLHTPNLTESKALLKDGYITLGSNHIFNNKTLVLSFDVDKLNDGDIIGLGHGETSYGGSGVEITKDRIYTYNYAAGRRTNLVNEIHGIDISGHITVTVKNGLRSAVVTIDNGKDIYSSTNFQWFGRNGDIFAKSVGAELKNVKVDWSCQVYGEDIWYFGDSYFDTTTTARWAYYMVEDGYTNFFFNGFPGRNTQQGLEDFKKAVEFGTPKYVVWCLGMNNGDSENGVNANYKNATEEMLAICKEKGITPILSTIPNTPTVINVHKNEWVKSSGYRYVDFAKGVNAEDKGSPWDAGMLSGDNVHPAVNGAEALYKQLKKDLADILVK